LLTESELEHYKYLYIYFIYIYKRVKETENENSNFYKIGNLHFFLLLYSSYLPIGSTVWGSTGSGAFSKISCAASEVILKGLPSTVTLEL